MPGVAAHEAYATNMSNRSLTWLNDPSYFFSISHSLCCLGVIPQRTAVNMVLGAITEMLHLPIFKRVKKSLWSL